MFLFAPLTLGSYFAFPVFALLIPIIVFRLLNEERVLRQEPAGYTRQSESGTILTQKMRLLAYRHKVLGWTITAIVCLIRDRI